jgi:hypothetical protein
MKVHNSLAATAVMGGVNTAVCVIALISAGNVGVHPFMLVVGTVYTLCNAAAWLYLWLGSDEVATFEKNTQQTIDIAGGQHGIDAGLTKLARAAYDAHEVVRKAGLDISTFTVKRRDGEIVYNEEADSRVKHAGRAQEAFDNAVEAVRTLAYGATPSIDYYVNMYYVSTSAESLPLPQTAPPIVEPIEVRPQEHVHLRKVT